MVTNTRTDTNYSARGIDVNEPWYISEAEVEQGARIFNALSGYQPNDPRDDVVIAVDGGGIAFDENYRLSGMKQK